MEQNYFLIVERTLSFATLLPRSPLSSSLQLQPPVAAAASRLLLRSNISAGLLVAADAIASLFAANVPTHAPLHCTAEMLLSDCDAGRNVFVLRVAWQLWHVRLLLSLLLPLSMLFLLLLLLMLLPLFLLLLLLLCSCCCC